MYIDNNILVQCSSLSSVEVESGNLYYDSRNNCNAIIRTNDNTLIAGCNSTTIPNSVTCIGCDAFYNCNSITSIIIPNSVASIEERAFMYCENLTSLSIPNSVKTIGNETFFCCHKLEFVKSEIINPYEISDDVFRDIGYNAVLQVPKGTIGKYKAFSGWTKYFQKIVDVTSYTLSITSSGGGYVTYSDNIIVINNTTRTYTLNEGSSATLTFTPNSGYRVGVLKVNGVDVTSSISNNKYTITNINRNTTVSVTFEEIPQTINFADPKVKSICVQNWDTNGDGELSYAEAEKVTDIQTNFRGITSFDELQYFTGLKTIGNAAFQSCYDLKSIKFPKSLLRIGPGAFALCKSLISITIPQSVTDISNNAFQSCNGISSITVEDGNMIYDSRNNCNAIIRSSDNCLVLGCKNTIIPNSTSSIGDWAFYECTGLSSITIPNGVASIGICTFANCYNLSSIIIPNSVISIGEAAFEFCINLKNFTIPNSVNIIGRSTFSQCTNMTNITIPNSVIGIDRCAFMNCTSSL